VATNPIDPPPNVDSTDDAVWRDWLVAARRPGVGAVVALTLIGGVLRFINLDQPTLLLDDAETYTRVCGTYQQLIAVLRTDGFVPLHYELYWLMGRLATLTPFVMRLIPAICGTLMIPAIYLLARQVASRRVATVAAALTAFSAFLLVYSRDAKMYMELWLAATLFVACLLMWMRTDTLLAWLVWVALACAMNGVHALGVAVVAVAFVIVMTHPLLTKRKLVVAVLGLAISLAGVAGYYKFFNRFGKQIEAAGWKGGSGLDWVGQRNSQFSKPMLLWDTAATWTLAYRSPRPPIKPPTRVITPVAVVSAILGALLLAGAMPWRKELRDDDPDEAPFGSRRGVLWMTIWLLLPCLAFFVECFVIGKRDVWTARYLGIVFPPLIVLIAIAFERLPHPALRGGAIALFIGANLIQFGLRQTVQNGMPVDLAAADVADAIHSDGEVRTVLAMRDDPSALSLGGSGGIFDFPGKYYLALATGTTFPPQHLRAAAAIPMFGLQTDVRANPPSVSRLIVWQDGPKTTIEQDDILKILGAEWTRASSTQFAVRDFWNWRSMFRCRRSVYVRAGAAVPTSEAPKKKHK
jgi:Dolichyl-phosphate-mannose-protein mannosyltransferase